MPAIERQPTGARNGHLFRLVFLLLGFFALAGCADSGDSWAQIQESGVLRVGIDPTFPPFALADDGGLVGIDVDLAQALADEMGLEAQFAYFGYDGLYDALTTDQVDVLISALVVMPERTKDIAYSAPYYDAGLILIGPAAEAGVVTVAGLDGQVLSVELGALGHVEALEWQRNLSNLTIQTYGDVGEAIAAVATGEAAAALVDSVSARLYLRDHPADSANLAIAPAPVTSEPYAMAVRIDERRLLAELNGALARLEANGKLKSIIDRYLTR